MRRLSHPWAMAHGLAVISSQALARQLLRSEDVRAFFRLYKTYFDTGEKGKASVGQASRERKCYIGTDTTIGLLVSFLPAVAAVDMINFEMNWPWPLPSRCRTVDTEGQAIAALVQCSIVLLIAAACSQI